MTHKIALLGTPRSGTQFLTAALRHYDLDVGHEKLLPDGICCGFWAWSKKMEGQMPCAAKAVRWFDHNATFEHEFHLVRHPIKVLRTMPHVISNAQTYGWWFKKLFGIDPDSEWTPKHTGLRYWVETHKLLLQRNLPKIYIDRIEEQWPMIAEPLGLGPLPDLDHRELKTGLPVTWANLRVLDHDLADEAYALLPQLGLSCKEV